MAAAVREALRILADEPGRRARLHTLIRTAEDALVPHGVTATGSQILPLVIGDDAGTMRRAAALQAAGFDVRGIRPPTVPAGGARLRISLSADHTPDEVEVLVAALNAEGCPQYFLLREEEVFHVKEPAGLVERALAQRVTRMPRGADGLQVFLER